MPMSMWPSCSARTDPSNNGPMRFTERELTVAVDELAQQLFAAGRPRWKRKHAEEGWQQLPPMQKYALRSTVGDLALPLLVALPERPTVGEVPRFSEEEWSQAADSAIPDADADKRSAALTMAQAAVELMPIRQDPDAIVIPDHL